MVTMKDVAKRAGVSITTVSHVINGTRRVTDELATKVQDAIYELGYAKGQAPHHRTLRAMQSVAVLIPDIANPFFPRVVRGVSDYAKTSGFNVILCNTDENPESEAQSITHLMRQSVEGFIIAPTAGFDCVLPTLLGHGVPFVIIDRRIDRDDIDQVYSDNETGAYTAVKHLLTLGHRRIGAIAGSRGVRAYDDRICGWQQALDEAGLQATENDLQIAGLGADAVDEAVNRLLGRNNAVSAVFSMSNPITLGVLRYFKSNGIHCPEDISLVGFDDSPWAVAAWTAVTSVAQQAHQMGYMAAERLLGKIRGHSTHPIQVSLSCRLVIRESCGTMLRE